MALSLALHAAALFLLLTYRPWLPDHPKGAPLKVDMLAEPPPPPEIAAPPSDKPALRSSARHPSPVPRADGGGASRAALDTTPVQMPSFQAQPAASVEPGAGIGAGEGEGSGSGSGAGEGEGAGGGKLLLLFKADWIVRPEGKMPQFNPPRAKVEHVSGGAVLHCRIDARNRARQCRIYEEHPRGYGFGQAALNISRYFRIRPPVLDGKPLHKAWVPIPVMWTNLPPVRKAKS
jgi:protein TonB